MKAKVKYQNGWVLELPKNGLAPMLFLEWVSEFRMGIMPIEKVINQEVFKIRLDIPKGKILNCKDYINLNL